MYVATFYSFKGGVGRSMALVNVAYELAKAGERVLMTDFDLEAPGLDSIGGRHAGQGAPGIVDFVGRYLATGHAPDVSEFVYPAALGAEVDDRLWIMPAGKPDKSYASRLNAINWGDLYANHDGYLLFEDLRAQWQRFGFKYVLIDSRTGHTDVGGICTRQLPDAVVILFIPNEQNLRGLRQIVTDIRREERLPPRRAIQMHFVMSNVPDLDDEELILARQLSAFRKELRITGRPDVIHRYDSLSLLGQSIFAKERPRSRLSKEYRTLTTKLRSWNVEDPVGAISFLSQVEAGRVALPPLDVDERLDQIRDAHASNGKVLYELGLVRLRRGQLPQALRDFTTAVSIGYREADVFVRRAIVNQALGDTAAAGEDAMLALSDAEAPAESVLRAMQILRTSRQDYFEKVASSPAVQNVNADEAAWLASQLQRSTAELKVAYAILVAALPRAESEDTRATIQSALALAAIGLGGFGEAMDALGNVRQREADTPDTFNYAMAEWGFRGIPPQDLFEKVLAKGRARESPEANWNQCVSLAASVCGDKDAAQEFLIRAGRAISSKPGPVFSCWRYLDVPPVEFRMDLDEMRSYFERGDPLPRVLRAAHVQAR